MPINLANVPTPSPHTHTTLFFYKAWLPVGFKALFFAQMTQLTLIIGPNLRLAYPTCVTKLLQVTEVTILSLSKD